MTAATKKKLEAVTNQINYLSTETTKKDNTIKYLAIGIVAVMVIVVFFVFIRKRRR